MKTPLKKNYQAVVKKLYILIFFGMVGLVPKPASSQLCDPTTPTYTVDLSSSPMATWISPNGKRVGLCCGASSPDVCVQFIITLNPAANGISFDIASGAVPPGALFYQINCGPIVRVGAPVCLTGAGPHILTFCKPGNNFNTYQITSYPMPALNGTQYVSQACSGMLSVAGLADTGITWTSVPFNATTNGYLNCHTNCDTVIVTHPGGTAPATVNYQVCGYVMGGCNPIWFCDTMTVHFVNNLAVNILPQNPTICFGGTPATVTATGSGGLAPFSYVWSTGSTSPTISVTQGTYYVQLTDAMGCSIARDTVIVNALPSPIAANAGPDQLMCNGAQQAVLLNGSFVASAGALWTGGAGTFSPNSATMNAIYTPTAAEISAGGVNLSLMTTGNSGCPPDTDMVRINIGFQPTPAISGPTPVCAYSSETYTVNQQAGVTYNWTVTNGTITNVTAGSITVRWGAMAAGTISLTATHSSTCDSVVTRNITINPTPVPVITGPATSCVYTTNTYNLATATSNTILWTVTGGQIIGANNATAVNIRWNTAGTNTITVSETTALGCDSTVSRTVTVGQTSIAQINGPSTICAYESSSYSTPVTANTSYTWTVTGGTITSNTGTAISVRWNAGPAGVITLLAHNTSGCDSTVTRNITINPTPIPVITGPTALCQYTSATYSLQTISGNSVTWTVTGGQIAGSNTSNTIQVLWNTAGAGTVRVTEANSLGCDSTVSVSVNVRQASIPQINGASLVCGYSMMTYSTSLTPGTTYNWTVTGGTIASNSGGAITVQWSNVASGTITLTAHNTSGCDSTITRAIVINPTPTPVIAGPTSACKYNTMSYYLQTASVNAISWNVTGGQILGSSTSNSINVQWTTAGTGTVTVTETHSSGCDSSVSVSVNVGQTSVPQINGASPVCSYSTTSYSTPLTPGTTYTWSVTGGTISSNTGGAISVLWSTASSGTITLLAHNNSGCDSTVSRNIVINPTPTPAIAGPSSACMYNTMTYYLQTVSSNSKVWNVTGGQIIGANNASSINVQWTTAGTGTVTVTETHTSGCDSAATISVNVGQTSVPLINGASPVCAYSTTAYSTPLTAGTTYAWSVTGGTITSNSGGAISVLWSTAASGSITLTAHNNSGCDSTVSRTIVINPTPTPAIAGPSSVCTQITETYYLQTVSSNSKVWNVTGGQIIGANNTNSINVVWNTPGIGTVTVTETHSLGCDSAVSMSVNVGQSSIPQINGPSNVCAYDNTSYSTPVTSNTVYAWSVTGGTITSNNGSAIVVNWNAVPSGVITLTATNASGCDSTVTRAVTISPTPTPALAGPTSVCTQITETYYLQTVSSNSKVWNVTGGQIIGANNTNSINVVWNTPGTGTVTVTETHPQGCDSTVSMSVNVGQSSIPQINGPSTVCAYSSTSYYTPFTSNTAYVWSVSGGTITSNTGTSIVVNWNAVPSGVISLTATNASGCDSTVTSNVTINPTPTPVIVGVASTCTHSTTTYSLQNSTSNTISWSVTGGTITGASNTNSIRVLWNSPGSNLVTVTVSNSLGCDSSTTFPVNVGFTAVPQINGPTTVCAYSSSSYYTTVWSNTTYTWNVNGGTIVSNTGPSITVVWNAVAGGTVSLTASNISGCDSTISTPITIHPTPVPFILGATANCTQTTDVYQVANPTSNTFLWTVTGGIIVGPVNMNSITVNWTTPGLGRVTVVETNSLGCDSTVSKDVLINARPWPVLSGNPQVCEMDTATYSVPFVSGDNFLWNVVGGSIVGFSVSNSIEVQWYTPGTGSVSCRQVSPNGCDSLVDMNVLINGRPSPYISGPASACETMNYAYSVVPTPGNVYNWSVIGGTILNGTTAPQVSVKWDNVGGGDVTLIESTPTGCANLANASVQIYSRPAPLINGSNVACISPLTTNYSVSGEPGVYYLWTVSGGSIMSGNGTSSISILWNTPGLHDVSVAAINLSTGCDSVMSKKINVDSLAQISVSALNFVGCAPMNINFLGNQSNPSYTYQWRFGDGGAATIANPSHTYLQPGTYPVTIYAANATGCADSAQAMVTVNPSPISAFTQSMTTEVYYVGSPLTFTNNSQGASQYMWDFGNGDLSTDFEPEYEYNSPGLQRITLVSTNQYGCSDTSNSILDVRLPEDLYVPNAFTPNGDAINDYFSIAERNITDLRVYIYNRWGQQVYKSDQVDFKWDGNFNGEPVKTDVYVYVIKASGFHGKGYDLRGTVTVVR